MVEKPLFVFLPSVKRWVCFSAAPKSSRRRCTRCATNTAILTRRRSLSTIRRTFSHVLDTVAGLLGDTCPMSSAVCTESLCSWTSLRSCGFTVLHEDIHACSFWVCCITWEHVIHAVLSLLYYMRTFYIFYCKIFVAPPVPCLLLCQFFCGDVFC